MNERKLIIRAAQGDETAFNQLYEKYDKKLAGYIYARINNHKEAEDLIATIWEKIITNLQDFKGKYNKSFESWLFTIAKNTLYNHYKSSHHRYPLVSIDAVKEIISPGVENIYDDFQYKNICKLIETLPKHQSKILYLKYFKELKNHEIAKKLNVSEKTIAAHLSRALKNLFKKCSNFDF